MKSFQIMKELERWRVLAGGGVSREGIVSREEAERYCRELTASHYENFTVISWLLPKHLKQHFANVYAYCRWADDLGDETPEGESLELLSWWKDLLREMFDSPEQARHPVFIALRETVREFQIPMAPFLDLIEAFEQDQRVRSYRTYHELLEYCRCSADPVGRIVLHLGRCVSEETFFLSDQICTGLQLTNFWQDVARDREIGRCYLPLEDLERFGYNMEDWDNRITNGAFLSLIEFEVNKPQALLESGFPLVQRVPRELRVDIELFIRGGLAILEAIRKIGYRVFERRVRLTKIQAAGIFLRSLFHHRVFRR